MDSLCVNKTVVIKIKREKTMQNDCGHASKHECCVLLKPYMMVVYLKLSVVSIWQELRCLSIKHNECKCVCLRLSVFDQYSFPLENMKERTEKKYDRKKKYHMRDNTAMNQPICALFDGKK